MNQSSKPKETSEQIFSEYCEKLTAHQEEWHKELKKHREDLIMILDEIRHALNAIAYRKVKEDE